MFTLTFYRNVSNFTIENNNFQRKIKVFKCTFICINLPLSFRSMFLQFKMIASKEKKNILFVNILLILLSSSAILIVF